MCDVFFHRTKVPPRLAQTERQTTTSARTPPNRPSRFARAVRSVPLRAPLLPLIAFRRTRRYGASPSAIRGRDGVAARPEPSWGLVPSGLEGRDRRRRASRAVLGLLGKRDSRADGFGPRPGRLGAWGRVGAPMLIAIIWRRPAHRKRFPPSPAARGELDQMVAHYGVLDEPLDLARTSAPATPAARDSRRYRPRRRFRPRSPAQDPQPMRMLAHDAVCGFVVIFAVARKGLARCFWRTVFQRSARTPR